MVIWIIGLSASGKSTLAEQVTQTLRQRGRPVALLDGDMLREVFANDAGHDVAGRALNAQRLSHLSRFLSVQGIDVVAAVLSIFPDWQKWNRENIEDYFQVHLDVDLEVLLRRETKSLYKRALGGEMQNVVGVDIPFPEPYMTDLQIDNNADRDDMSEFVLKILDHPRLLAC